MGSLAKGLYVLILIGVVAMFALIALCIASGIATTVFLILAFIHRHEVTTFYLWWYVVCNLTFTVTFQLLHINPKERA